MRSEGSTAIGRHFPDAGDPQEPARVSVVLPTVMRPILNRALQSIFEQDFDGRIQILVGVDAPSNEVEALSPLLATRPSHVSVTTLTLPYSTSVRHGGVHQATDGGALRTILSFMANARHVAYLDDDNAWRADHLRKMVAAVEGKVWAFARRMLVHADTGEELGEDRWDSVGVGKGRFAAKGGFVDPNCLIIDKVRAARILGHWSETSTGVADMTADRNFFSAISRAPHAVVDEPTVLYTVRSTNILLKFMSEGVEF